MPACYFPYVYQLIPIFWVFERASSSDLYFFANKRQSMFYNCCIVVPLH